MKMGILDGALHAPRSQSNFYYLWQYERSQKKEHSEKFVAGLIGEREGRKWLKEQGYEVYEFGMIEHYFQELKDTSERLKKRRKQKYIEQDKAQIRKYEEKLVDILANSYEQMRKFYFEFLPKSRELRRSKLFPDQVGGISPDFIVKKNDVFSIVEVKANTSQPTKHQRMCFNIAKIYGFNSMVLRVTVESHIAKEMKLIAHKS
jgi:hypothetical protein